MAYAAAITRTDDTRGTDGYVVFEVAETEAGAATEYILDLVPTEGTITLFTATLTSGTGTTIAPKAGLATGWSASTQDEVFTRSAAAHHNAQDVVRYTALNGKLYIRSVCDAGSDNAVSTRITIRAGHGG